MSKLPFELLLALRYLRPKRTFVSIITLISIIGVALGVAVLIIVISVMSGFDHDLREKILGFNPHLTVGEGGAPMKNYARVAGMIAQNKNVRSVAPFILGPVLVETEGDSNRPAMQDAPILSGIDPQAGSKMGNLSHSLIAGEFDLSGRGVIIGSIFAENLHLQVGDHLSIYSAREIKKMKAARDRKEDEAILPDDYEVRGIFDVGYYEDDAALHHGLAGKRAGFVRPRGLGSWTVRDAERSVSGGVGQGAIDRIRWAAIFISPPGWNKIPPCSTRSSLRRTSCFTCCFSS